MATTTPAAHATPAAGLSFENYRMVRTRNVFDPDRRSLSAPSSSPVPAVVKPSDYVALTGTLLNADKSLAFFSGSRSDFNKVLSVRDKIADATITDITAAGVEVDRGGKKVTVAVGQTVPLDNSAPTAAPLAQTLPSGGGDVASPNTAPNNPPTASASAATAAAANGLSSKQQEIMKRMMEKRQQDGLK